MSSHKSHPAHETVSYSDTHGVSYTDPAVTHDNDNGAELSPNDEHRALTKRLNRRGRWLRVKRRRGDDNVPFAEKQRLQVLQRITHARDHWARLQHELLVSNQLLTQARDNERRRKKKDHT